MPHDPQNFGPGIFHRDKEPSGTSQDAPIRTTPRPVSRKSFLDRNLEHCFPQLDLKKPIENENTVGTGQREQKRLTLLV